MHRFHLLISRKMQTVLRGAHAGRRGAALLAAVGVVVPQAGPLSPSKASLSPSPKAKLASAGSPQQAQRRSSPRRDVFLRQALPKNYTMLEDFFCEFSASKVE